MYVVCFFYVGLPNYPKLRESANNSWFFLAEEVYGGFQNAYGFVLK